MMQRSSRCWIARVDMAARVAARHWADAGPSAMRRISRHARSSPAGSNGAKAHARHEASGDSGRSRRSRDDVGLAVGSCPRCRCVGSARMDLVVAAAATCGPARPPAVAVRPGALAGGRRWSGGGPHGCRAGAGRGSGAGLRQLPVARRPCRGSDPAPRLSSSSPGTARTRALRAALLYSSSGSRRSRVYPFSISRIPSPARPLLRPSRRKLLMIRCTEARTMAIWSRARLQSK